jgi:hypothetical protein
MSRAFFLLATIILLSITISASCEENQIDINIASAEELDEIIYIGPARAEQIITLRPFDSIDDLIKINGIGEIYLSAIKAQELACVGEEAEEEVDEKVVEDSKKEKEVIESSEGGGGVDGGKKSKGSPLIELETISLNPKVIKSGDVNENLNTNNYPLYGLIAFCLLIVVLFMFKKNRYKNEFR